MQKKLWEPEHDPAVEAAIIAAGDAEREDNIKFLARMRNVFIPIKNAAQVCLWETERVLDNA